MAATDGSQRRTYTDAERNEALALYLEVGAAEAARRLGFAAGTIRQWAHRAGMTDTRHAAAKAGVAAARLTWAQRRAAITVRFGDAAASFLEKAIGEKSARNSRDLMASADMAVKNAQLLSDGATGRVELTEPERRKRVQELRNELAERREANSAKVQ
jgi:transposase-like protein